MTHLSESFEMLGLFVMQSSIHFTNISQISRAIETEKKTYMASLLKKSGTKWHGFPFKCFFVFRKVLSKSRTKLRGKQPQKKSKRYLPLAFRELSYLPVNFRCRFTVDTRKLLYQGYF